MIVSLEWLKDYTEIKVDANTFCDRMTVTGSELETLELVGNDMKNVVVGKIVKIEKHPDADKLVVCQLDIGQKELCQIVTGAPNVFEGAYVPVALDGSVIPGPLHGQPKVEGGVKITKGKLRGVESNGMLCSFGELGFNDKVVPINQREGIWILDKEYPVGSDFAETMELKDAIADFDITPNRSSDCLSMLGIAREAAATLGTKLVYPETKCQKEVGDVNDYIQAEVKSDLCKRYTARVVKNVKIEPSPWWMQRRLIHAGMRPINNIVDITNFVMIEYGQPLHAFNIDSIEGHKIIVDVAKAGDKFTTLDGTERTLEGDMLMINDAKKAVAIAGVMGGLNSEITDDTNTIVIESANFLSNSVRFTAKKLGLRTEASGRYEKGIDPNLCEAAADRVCYLIEKLGCGEVVGGRVDIYPHVEKATPIHARVSRINKVLGINISRETMVKYLESLEMKVEGTGDEMIVTAPTVRQDMNIEEDVIEEVARMYGYDELPVTIPKGNSEAGQAYDRDIKDMARETLCGMGLNEILTYSFVSPKSVDDVRIDEDSIERAFVKIMNPLGDDTSVMRTLLIPQMLEVLGRNYSRNVEEVKAFEIGNTFVANMLDNKGLPYEADNLSIGMYGKGCDFYLLKGIIVAFLEKLGIKNVKFIPESEYGPFHPGRCARVVLPVEGDDDVELGIFGEVHPQVADNFGIDTKCYVGELFFETLVEFSDTTKLYHQLPKYPSMTRDIALVCDEDMTVEEIQNVIISSEDTILTGVKLFDIYRGATIPEGKKSMAFSLTYRHDERTLTDDDVQKAHNKVLDALKEKLNVALREI